MKTMVYKRANGNGTVYPIKDRKTKKIKHWVAFAPATYEFTINGNDIKTANNKAMRQRIPGTFPTRDAAIIALNKYLDSPVDLTAANTTLQDVIDMWFSDYQQEKPYMAARITPAIKRIAAAKLNLKPINKITLYDMQTLIDTAANDVGARSLSDIKRTFDLCFEYAVKKDIISPDKIKTDYLKIPETKTKEKEIYTPQEITALLNSPTSDPVINAYVALLLYTGCRGLEALTIQKTDIDINRRLIDIHGTKTKNARRFVPIHKALLPILKQLIADTPGKYLFIKDKEKQEIANAFIKGNYGNDKKTNKLTYKTNLTNYRNTKIIKPLTAALPFLETKTPHTARHTFTTYLVEKCGFNPNDERIKMILGHNNGNITSLYTHIDPVLLVPLVDRIDYTPPPNIPLLVNAKDIAAPDVIPSIGNHKSTNTISDTIKA